MEKTKVEFPPATGPLETVEPGLNVDTTLYQFIGLGEPGGPQWEEMLPDRNGRVQYTARTIIGRFDVWWDQCFCYSVDDCPNGNPCDSIDHGKQLAAEHYKRAITSVLREVNIKNMTDSQRLNLRGELFAGYCKSCMSPDCRGTCERDE